MEDYVEAVKKYYDTEAQMEWDRLNHHPFEFILTTFMMDKYIKPGDRILDIGGGPGRYAIHYAEKGCKVTLVDLSEGNIQLAREMAEKKKVSINTYAENCLFIDRLDLGEFDHVFLMGPLYHLIEENDRIHAVEIALQKLKKGGVFYCSFILAFAGMIYDMKNGPGYLQRDLESTFGKAIINSLITGTNCTGTAFTSACFFSQRQLEPFMSRFNLEKLHLFGQEGILAPNEKQILSYPKEELDLWIETAKKLLEVPELLALSEHAMYIGKKKI